MTDLTTLRQLAEAATPGPWDVYGAVVWSPDARSVIAGASATEPTSGVVEYERPKWSAINQPARNAAYIAAANPQAILALLDRLERAETLVAQCKATLEAMHPSAGVPDGDVARIYNGMMEALGDG